MSTISLQVTIGGLSANSNEAGRTLLGALDTNVGLLMIDMERDVKPGMPEVRMPGCAVATNNSRAPDYDALFTEEDIRDAINDYFGFTGRGLLSLQPATARFDPASAIEPDGLDERGRKYRIGQGMTNGQMAVIAMCWFAMRQETMALQGDRFEELQALQVFSIGLPGGQAQQRGEVPGYIMGGQVKLGADGWPV
jgi:hypothetical protein